jgi:hypothetical protein
MKRLRSARTLSWCEKLDKFYSEANKINAGYISAEVYTETTIQIIGERFGKLDLVFSISRLDVPSYDCHPEVLNTSDFLLCGYDITLYERYGDSTIGY